VKPTHQPAYLEAENADSRASKLIMSLESSTAATPEYSKAQRIASLAQQKLAELAQTTDLSQRGDQAQALAIVNSNRGKAMMDGIRALADEISITAG
jgi:CHASE3 domain sensor protein